MMLSSEGVVLSSTKYGESSIIAHVLSKENGLMSIIASRSKKNRSVISNYFQPLSHIQFVCYYTNKSQISRIKEINFAEAHQFNNNDVSVNALRFFLAEFLYKIIKEEEKNETLYSFIEGEIKQLLNQELDRSFFHISFLLKLLNHLGIQPMLNENHNYFDILEGCSVTNKPIHSEFFEKETMMLFVPNKRNSGKLDKVEKSRLLNALLKYYSVQTSLDFDNLKTKKVLEVIFS